jgi:hypothetical protein
MSGEIVALLIGAALALRHAALLVVVIWALRGNEADRDFALRLLESLLRRQRQKPP